VALTPSQTVGPYFHGALLAEPLDELTSRQDPAALTLRGVVTDGAGDPVPDAMVEIWHPALGFGRAATAPDGTYTFVIVKPAPAAQRAPHLQLAIFARGLLRQSVTCMYFPDEDDANAGDALLGALTDPADRRALVARTDAGGLRFDIRLHGDDQTPFFDPGGPA
jgi:protocatechuate 3,4-dioxygenase alpha subunit